MRINKKHFWDWINALDSGKYKQTKKTLQDKNGYCCLGVGCDVMMGERALREYGGTKLLIGVLPEDQPRCPAFLKQINNDFKIQTGYKLSVLNDDRGFSFQEIATCLELVYIHKILS